MPWREACGELHRVHHNQQLAREQISVRAKRIPAWPAVMLLPSIVSSIAASMVLSIVTTTKENRTTESTETFESQRIGGTAQRSIMAGE